LTIFKKNIFFTEIIDETYHSRPLPFGPEILN